MMLKKRAVFVWSLVALLIFALLLPILLLAVRPDWRFILHNRLRVYPSPSPEAVSSFEHAETLSIIELLVRDGVVRLPTLLLISGEHPLPDDYEAEIAVYNGAEMHPLMVNAYIALRDAVEQSTGERIYVSDDYRTREEQEKIFLENGENLAARVGCSEHEAGLALDVYVKGYGGASFLKSAAGREVNRICSEYGFIIRYGDGKEDITGFSYEPWHLRYVGLPHAQIMSESNLSLEEYLECLAPEVWYAYEDSLILRTTGESFSLPMGYVSCTVSPDNTGMYIVTLKQS